MAAWELRPLSLGEILDRTFTLYRQNFLLFLGISALPHLLILGVNLVQTLILMPAPSGTAGGAPPVPRASSGLLAFGFSGLLILVFVYMVAFLFAQGGTIFAVSDLYLGRPTSIGSSLGKMWGELLNLFGVTLLNGLAVIAGCIFLIIPGIYLMCRLLTSVPAALLEDLGARQALERSFALTKDNAGRAFVIFVLYLLMLYAAMLLFAMPFLVLLGFTARDPGMLRVSMALLQVGNFLAGILVGPFLLIATSVFYYDLRVRKEAFDLQLMMNPSGNPSGGPSVPTMLA